MPKLLTLPAYFLFIVCSCLLALPLWSQDSTLQLPEKYLGTVEKQVTNIQSSLDKKTSQYLHHFQKAEARLLRKLARKDSAKAAQLQVQSQQKYQQLQQALKGERLPWDYMPSLDTLTTSLKFLVQHQELLSKTKDASAPLSQALNNVDGLKSSLGKAEIVNQFLRERQAQLASQLNGLPLLKQFKQLHKQAYYYQAQVDEYKALLKDKREWEKKALELLSKTKAFQSFMRKNSQLASLFRLPGSEGENTPASLAGLQTRAQVNAQLQERFGNDPAVAARLRENVQAAQGELNSLKNKAESFQSGSVGNSNNELAQPNFKPNSQKTKSFLKRLEIGTNIQSQKARWLFPVVTDLGLSIGYKLNDKSVAGVGAAYKLGLGSGWQHLALTHQGLGVRSFVEYQLKGSLFLSGGYEQNYRPQLKEAFFPSPFGGGREGAAWQQSGLLGVTKKYKVSKKLKGNMQLLWDFLSYRQKPQPQAIQFRIGYSLK